MAFDFLGFGASDKSAGVTYSFEQQLGDLSAVIQGLGLGLVVLVAHDSSGIAGINFAVEHPYKVASLCILNSAYDNSPLNVWPEMIVCYLRTRPSRHSHWRSRKALRSSAGCWTGSG